MQSFGGTTGKKTPKLDIDVSKDDDDMPGVSGLKKTKSVTNKDNKMFKSKLKAPTESP